MTEAFIMLNVEAGSEEEVLKKLRALDILEEAFVSYGVYDLVIKIKAENIEALGEAVNHKIRGLEQVESTLTLVVTDKK